MGEEKKSQHLSYQEHKIICYSSCCCSSPHPLQHYHKDAHLLRAIVSRLQIECVTGFTSSESSNNLLGRHYNYLILQVRY